MLQLLFGLSWIYSRKHDFALRRSHFKLAMARRPVKRCILFTLSLVFN